jgi:hypothetical protein
MRRNKLVLILVPVVILLINAACGFNVSTASIKNAQLARDNEGTQPTTTFAAGDTFFCNVDLSNAPDDTAVKAVWTAVQVEGTEPNLKLDESELKSGSSTLHFKLSNDNSWPAGKYKVDLYLNDKLDRTVEFQVQ